MLNLEWPIELVVCRCVLLVFVLVESLFVCKRAGEFAHSSGCSLAIGQARGASPQAWRMNLNGLDDDQMGGPKACKCLYFGLSIVAILAATAAGYKATKVESQWK